MVHRFMAVRENISDDYRELEVYNEYVYPYVSIACLLLLLHKSVKLALTLGSSVFISIFPIRVCVPGTLLYLK